MEKDGRRGEQHKNQVGNSWAAVHSIAAFRLPIFRLRDGQTLLFGPDASPDRVLPEDLRLPILRSITAISASGRTGN